MWVLRILTGQQAGGTFPLSPGTNTLGRSPRCGIVIESPGVSKEHAKIDVLNDKIIVTDMKSSNGTFVDGIKIKTQSITLGQKFSLHNIIMDVAKVQAEQNVGSNNQNQQHQPFSENAEYDINQHPYPDPQIHAQAPQQGAPAEPPSNDPQGPINLAKNYIDNVVMPGVYKIPENLEFKWTLGVFIICFILFVTALSGIPMMRILKDSIQTESRRRAVTIAKTVAEFNKNNVAQGINSALTTVFAAKEPGVDKAYILDALDQSILAPPVMAGKYPNTPFVLEATKNGNNTNVKQINSSTIVAVVGIPVYNTETGENSNRAYAVVEYNMGQLAVSDSKTISLFVQTLFIALVTGAILFLIMYKVITRPIIDINRQLDQALTESGSEITSSYQFKELQSLISNINSSLSRAFSGDNSDDSANPHVFYDRSSEMDNMVQVIGFPAIAIQASDKTITAINVGFEEKTNHSIPDLLYGELDKILDQALRLSIVDLIETVAQAPDKMATNQLDINGESFDITAHGIYGTNELAYYIIVLLPTTLDDGGHV